jgi:hypothetical protein
MLGPDGVTGGEGDGIEEMLKGKNLKKKIEPCLNDVYWGGRDSRCGGAGFRVGQIRGEGALEHRTPGPNIPHQGAGKGCCVRRCLTRPIILDYYAQKSRETCHLSK